MSDLISMKRSVFFSGLLLGSLLAGCGGSAPPPATADARGGASRQGDVVERIGDVEIRASVVQTSALPDSVARQYGIERDAKTLLLLVAVRQGPLASAIALPARVTAKVTDLRGGQQEIPMRELRAGTLVDSVGTTRTTLPDTLRFDLTVAVDAMAPVRMRFEREFYPQ
jgi:hypothetical protein